MNELKVKAYDLIATIEAHQAAIHKLQAELQKINQEIFEEAKKIQEVKGE